MRAVNGLCVIVAGFGFSFITSCGQDHAKAGAGLRNWHGGEQGDWSESIIGGKRVREHSAIALATVSLMEPSGWGFCSGTLISRRHVLTAAHCLATYQGGALYVGFGTVPELKPEAVAARYVVDSAFDVAAVAQMHPLHPPHDLALVTLASDAPAGFVPMAMLTANDELTLGEPMILAGFGLTRADDGNSGELRRVTSRLTAVWPEAAELEYGGTPGRSACNGDSGGPAFVRRGERFKLVGVTSRGVVGCDGGGIYTDVRRYQDWIKGMEQDVPPAPVATPGSPPR